MVKKNKKEESEESEEGMSLDDAFGDDEDVEYAESKPKKQKKKKEEEEDDEDEGDEDLEEISGEKDFDDDEKIKIKASKPVAKIKKGDRIRVDGMELEVDEHYVMIDHGSTKEMVIELFNPLNDKDYQLRYFDDQLEESIGFFELEEIVYVRRKAKKIEW